MDKLFNTVQEEFTRMVQSGKPPERSELYRASLEITRKSDQLDPTQIEIGRQILLALPEIPVQCYAVYLLSPVFLQEKDRDGILKEFRRNFSIPRIHAGMLRIGLLRKEDRSQILQDALTVYRKANPFRRFGWRKMLSVLVFALSR